MRLEDIKANDNITGFVPNDVVIIIAVVRVSVDAITVIARTSNGQLKERLLSRDDEASISIATAGRPWAFDGDGEKFKLAVEAKRIDLAWLFDPMMAVHTSNVEPLPHQITAVYESMLPRQPLRFVLADDPGAGKTIMAGLYIRELIIRADARRIVIVAPGSLVEQWRDEMYEKFGLEFRVYGKELEAASPSGNPFEDHPQLIVRLDQMTRNPEIQEKICQAGWDLVVFDEAHKLSAHFYGQKIKETARFKFANRLGACTRHLLLMTATPHNGKEEDFQLFMSILDSDRFYGKFRDGVHKVDTSDLMRRMIKEEMVRFDGTPLFPERRAYTVNYDLSDLEADLYTSVTHYVKTEMGKADQLEGHRKGSVGFALTSLQRRLASSPEAIYQSLKRRKERLEKRLQEEQIGLRGQLLHEKIYTNVPDDDDDLDAEEQETLEETLVDDATAAQTIAELEAEIKILGQLEVQASELVASGKDRKWEELSNILQKDARMKTNTGLQRKLIIFTEHRDTLNYLKGRIVGVLGIPDAVVSIHGGTPRDERRKIQTLFRSDPVVRILVATDAAGEGVNLQNANLMVNYDLPWNPNRLEQRFGRIHRIGQQEVCHLWNLVSKETREGEVYHRLLTKLNVENQALQGRVFDILGEVFEGDSLKDLLLQAILYSDLPETRSRLHQKIDIALDREHIIEILNRNALAQESMSAERLFAVKEEMEKAEARKLQPYFVRSFFKKAFESLGGSLHPREAGRYEITWVPGVIMERDRQITGRSRRDNSPVVKRYERVCFTKDAVQPFDKPGLTYATLLHPGHPLLLSVSDLIIQQNNNLLRQGAVLLDPSDEGDIPSLLFLLTHDVLSGDGQILSKRLQFIRVTPDGNASFAGWAPHLDLEPISMEEREKLSGVLQAPWLAGNLEQKAIAHASSMLVPEHVKEVTFRRTTYVDKTLSAVHERLTKEIDYWTDRYEKLRDDLAAGKDVRLPLENIKRTILDLSDRLGSRKRELISMRHISSSTPVLLSGALVIPAGLINRLNSSGDEGEQSFSVDSMARKRIEMLAMQAVRNKQEALGHMVVDVSAQKCGWDLTSYPPAIDGRQPNSLHIEVKGRIKGAPIITISRNEMLYAFNQAEQFVLAIVLVNDGEEIEGPFYIKNPFQEEPGWGVASINFDIKSLLHKAEDNNGI